MYTFIRILNCVLPLQSGDESNASDSASDKLEITNNGRSSSSRRDERDAIPKSEPSEYGEDLGESVDHYRERGERNLYPTGLLGIRGSFALNTSPSARLIGLNWFRRPH
jgi:hypothetical protein